jgi:peptide/nickel transport system substrate-binding protein
MRRRLFLGTTAAALVMPAIACGKRANTLRFVPQSDVTALDPHLSTTYVTRNHALLIFDTLYGFGPDYKTTPQMAGGHVIEDDGKRRTIRLPDGLKFHDGEQVLARDCVASIKRWWQRDAIGTALRDYTDDLSAKDDRTIVFRLRKPFPLLDLVLGKSSIPVAAMMPERLALKDVSKQIAEMVGSGPYRWKADERAVGARAVYERNCDYVPCSGGRAGWIAGPKVAHFDRVEWIVILDESTAASALRTGEVDWWEWASAHLIPALKKSEKLVVEIKEPTGMVGHLRRNHKQPPFDNPAIRRAVQAAVKQDDYVQAMVGDDPAMGRGGVGLFTPGSALASTVDMDVYNAPRDPAKIREMVKAAGYSGEKVVLIGATDVSFRRAMAEVTLGMLRDAAFNAEFQALDWGAMTQRRENKGPIDKGGWNIAPANTGGIDLINPSGHAYRANGDKVWFGWPVSEKIEAFRTAWIDAPDLAAQRKIADEMQHQWFIYRRADGKNRAVEAADRASVGFDGFAAGVRGVLECQAFGLRIGENDATQRHHSRSAPSRRYRRAHARRPGTRANC